MGLDLSLPYDDLTKDTMSIDDLIQRDFESMLDNDHELLSKDENLPP